MGSSCTKTATYREGEAPAPAPTAAPHRGSQVHAISVEPRGDVWGDDAPSGDATPRSQRRSELNVSLRRRSLAPSVARKVSFSRTKAVCDLPASLSARQLVRLIYSSEAVPSFDPATLDDLAAAASVNNELLNITGALVFLNGVFIQVLEGEFQAVDTLYEKIKADPRHENVTLVRIAPIDEREYSSWGMRATSIDEDTDAHLIIRSMLATIRSSFSILDKYTQPAITALIRQGQDPLQAPPEYGDAIVVVCGLTGVWRVGAASMRGMVNIMGAFYAIVERAAADNDGEVVKHVGENVFMMFQLNSPTEAFKAAQRVVSEAAQLCRALDMQTVNARAAMTQGRVVRGNIGSKSSTFDYTLLGDCVNTGSRLCNLPLDENFCVLMDPASRDALKKAHVRARLEAMEDVHLKGKMADQTIYKWQAEEDDLMTIDDPAADPGELGTPELPMHKAMPVLGTSGVLLRLTYVSRAEYALTSDEVEELAERAAENNRKLGVTGVLLYCEDVFLQILEGPPDTVRTLLAKISKDDRHIDLTTILAEETNERKFQQWGMRGFGLGDGSEFVLSVARRMLDTMAKAFKVVERYTPPKVLRLLTSGQNPASLKPTLNNVVVLVTDLVAFTTISESMDASQLMRCVNAVLKTVLQSVDDYGGSANKLVGDMVVAHFPGGAAHKALAAALQIQSRMASLRRSDDVPGVDDPSILHVGVGLAYGPAVEANIGRGRLDFSLFGKCVEEAIEAEAHTRMSEYNVLMTEEMKDLLELLHPNKVIMAESDHLYSCGKMSNVRWDPATTTAMIRERCQLDGYDSSANGSSSNIPTIAE